MVLSEFNKTLEWHGQARFISFPHCENLTIEFSDIAGGPGEDVRAFIKFTSVCFINSPIFIETKDSIQIHEYGVEESKKLLPVEFDYDDSCFHLIRFFDGKNPLSYFVVSYGYQLWQEPSNWVFTPICDVNIR